jgi:REP element-mobilizing transposase RayT
VTALKFPPVVLTNEQIYTTAAGFATGVGKSRLTIWACSILPEHVHMVVARHTYEVEQVCILLKGQATKALKTQSLHPLARFAKAGGKLPSMWGEGQWKVYLDTEEGIEAAIHYVEENPVKEGRPRQQWPFVVPFAGLDKAGWTTYH